MKNEPCTYCGENKWDNPMKHLAEVAKFLQEKIEECQELIKGYEPHVKI